MNVVKRYVAIGVDGSSSITVAHEKRDICASLAQRLIDAGLKVSDVIEVDIPSSGAKYRHKFIVQSDVYGTDVVTIQSEMDWPDLLPAIKKDREDATIHHIGSEII